MLGYKCDTLKHVEEVKERCNWWVRLGGTNSLPHVEEKNGEQVGGFWIHFFFLKKDWSWVKRLEMFSIKHCGNSFWRRWGKQLENFNKDEQFFIFFENLKFEKQFRYWWDVNWNSRRGNLWNWWCTVVE